MEIKLNIGEVIQKPSLKDTFILHVKSMSGDADEFHTNEMHFGRDEEAPWINVFLDYFVRYSKLEWSEQCDLRAGVLNSRELESFGDIEDGLLDLVGSDVTSDGQWYARPDSIWVTYVDSDGLEHDVDIEIDGVAYTKIYRRGLQKK